jgi:hypothetical protein
MRKSPHKSFEEVNLVSEEEKDERVIKTSKKKNQVKPRDTSPLFDPNQREASPAVKRKVETYK